MPVRDANRETLQAAARAARSLDLNGAVRAVTGANLDLNGQCRRFYAREFNECHDELLALLESRAATLDGTAGSYLSSADHADYGTTGDFRVEVDLSIGTWKPGGVGDPRILASKWGAAGQRSWLFDITDAGAPRLEWSADGTASVATLASPTVVGHTSGRGAVAVALDVDNGAGYTATFYTAASIFGPWTTLDAASAGASATSVFDSTADIRVGTDGSDNPALLTRQRLVGDALGFQLLDAGTVVAHWDPGHLGEATTTFLDREGHTWSVNSAVVS